MRRLAALLHPCRGRLGPALLLTALGSGGILIVPWIVKNLVGAALVEGEMPLHPRVCALLLGIVVVSGAAGAGSLLLMFEVAHRVTARLRSQYVEQLVWAPLSLHRRERTGDLLDRLSSSTNEVENFIKHSVVAGLGVALSLVGSAVMMFVLSWRLALLVLSTFPLASLALRALYQRSHAMHAESREAHGDLMSHLHTLLLGVEVVKAFNAQARETEQFGARQEQLLAVQRRTSGVIALVEPCTVGLGMLTFVLLLLYGGKLLTAGVVSPDRLVAFLLYLLVLLPMARSIGSVMARAQQARVALERLDAILQAPREIDPPRAVPLPAPFEPRVEIRNVCHRYSDRELVLAGASFVVEAGERVGIVGESGAGKTTLFSLLLRFYEPESGQVLVGGRDVGEVTAESLRACLAYVPQDLALFDASILENVRYGRVTATDDEVRQACEAAQIHDFIATLPRGYGTVVADRGANLSGGERQRLALARALLKDAPILLLDEATSSLDARTEHRLRLAMDTAMEGRTALVIAHRLATVAHLPRLLILSGGRITDEGTHEELLERCATYQTFVSTQLLST